MRGTGVFSDIALDNIIIQTGDCLSCPQPNNIDFESGQVEECNIAMGQASDDDFDWSISVNSSGTPSANTGPRHAQSGTSFIYIEASGRNVGDMARLALPRPALSGQVCVRLNYFMFGFHTGQLEFYTEDHSATRRTIWYIKGQQQTTESDEWRQAAIDVDIDLIQRFGLTAVRGSGYSSDVAVDHITYEQGPCEQIPDGVLFKCSFEMFNDITVSTLCSMGQEVTEQFEWMLWRGATNSQMTGPSFAHSDNYYIYIEASKPRKTGDEARILVPKLNVNDPVCVTFFYHMYGFHTGSLSVYVRTVDGTMIIVWLTEGPKGNSWMEGRVTVNILNRDDQIGFRGIVGTEYSSDIGLDSVEIREDVCE